MLDLKHALGQSAFFLMNKRLGLKYGWDATAVLCALIDAEDLFKTEDGWVYQTESKIQELTGISGNRQDKFLKIFIVAGFIEKKVMGLPAKRYFKLNNSLILREALGLSDHDFSNLLSPKMSQLVSLKRGDLKAENREALYNKKNKDKEIINKDKAQSQAMDALTPKKRNTVDWGWTDRLVERFGVTEQIAEDFITARKAKRAVITETVLDNFKAEVKKINDAGVYFAEREAFAYWTASGWQGFKADWYLKQTQTNAKNGYQKKETIEECMARLSQYSNSSAEVDVTPSKNGLGLPVFDDFDSDDPFAYRE